jgi:vacuolar-type H+-ATPase subunit I/STV1
MRAVFLFVALSCLFAIAFSAPAKISKRDIEWEDDGNWNEGTDGDIWDDTDDDSDEWDDTDDDSEEWDDESSEEQIEELEEIKEDIIEELGELKEELKEVEEEEEEIVREKARKIIDQESASQYGDKEEDQEGVFSQLANMINKK